MADNITHQVFARKRGRPRKDINGSANDTDRKTINITETKKKKNIIIDDIVPLKTINNLYTLNKIVINNKIYYTDKYNCIFDENITLVGICHSVDGITSFLLFSDISDIMNISIPNILH